MFCKNKIKSKSQLCQKEFLQFSEFSCLKRLNFLNHIQSTWIIDKQFKVLTLD